MKSINASLIWFGAAVSIAEILTGTCLAPLGIKLGTIAILLGHLIGCTLLFFAGYIGAKTNRSAMETTKISFGKLGAKFFALLNVIQLVGWTSIMIYDGSLSLEQVVNCGRQIWVLVIGLLIALWIITGITNFEKFNAAVIASLFSFLFVLCKVIFFSNGNNNLVPLAQNSEELSFGMAVELSCAMPLSWLPLISDYTKDSKKPFKVTFLSALVYGIISSWMYFIGMGASIFTGESEVATIMVKAGLGTIALVIIILSTVTTTFLDAFSSGISLKTIFPHISEKYSSIAVTAIGTLLAAIWPMDNITNFLYLIGSVFAPMIVIQLTDYFVLKSDSSEKKIDYEKILLWILGFLIYRLLMNTDLPTGCTLPSMAITFALTCIVRILFKTIKSVLR